MMEMKRIYVESERTAVSSRRKLASPRPDWGLVTLPLNFLAIGRLSSTRATSLSTEELKNSRQCRLWLEVKICSAF